MGKKFVLSMMALLTIAVISMAANHRFTLVIDAGHGGKDVGARGSYLKEKNINLKTALAFGRYVERNCPDVRVVYTRKTDVFIPLHTRADIANKNKADLFVSIHTNAMEGSRRTVGLETYTMGMRRSDEKLSAAKRENAVITMEDDYKQHYEGYDPHSAESNIMFEFMFDKNMEKSVEMARLVQKYVCATANRVNKGVKQDVFCVLRETSMPACLVELGFITTPQEENFLSSDDNLDTMARGIYQAFLAYRNKYDDRIVVPYKVAEDNNRRRDELPRQTESRTIVNNQVVETPVATAPVAAQLIANDDVNNRVPVFRIQLLASSTKLYKGDRRFKGITDISSFQEGNLIKYTYGESTNYNTIYRLRKSILDKFPEAFIIAFKNGAKMNINEAIREFQRNKNH